ncbi:MAG TPA: hypothetical protein VNT99_07395 [Methylomirabilota bacterium]|nr:hypothetical protein [Methylomirabilota bacterium]
MPSTKPSPRQCLSTRGYVFFLLLASVQFCPGNPVSINPTSLIAFGIVAFAAFLVEAGIIALILLFSGLAPVRVMVVFFVINAAIFWLAFFPWVQTEKIPLLVSEALIVLIEAAVLKTLSGFEYFHGGEFERLPFSRALLASLAGNAASFFVGVVGAGSPWVQH